MGFIKHGEKPLKALQPKTLYMMFPFDMDNPYAGPTDKLPNACIPVETKNHTYYDNMGNPLSGHWLFSPGRHHYTFNATQQLSIKDSIRLHQITSHLHPFAERLQLVDRTKNTVIYNCESENFEDKIGLKSTPTFTSTEGVWLYENREYEMTLEVNNTTNTDQEMMASMAIFYYDEEMTKKTSNYK